MAISGLSDNSHKIRLTGPTGVIVFEASSPIQEDRQATYQGFNIVHLPTSLFSYHSTTGRKFSVTGKLVSRTPNEADANSRYLDLARSWLLPEFGTTGATPPVILFKAYNNNNLNNVQTILTSYSWAFPEEVDYIWGGKVPMPVIGTLQINLEEIYSAEQITAGSWKINVGSGGFFDRDRDIPSWESQINGSLADVSIKHFPAVGGALMTASLGLGGQSGPGIAPTIPGVIAGRLTRNLGAKLLNSPAIRELTKQLPPIASNVFIQGSNAVIGALGKAATLGVSSITGGSQAPSFNRAPSLATPTFVNQDD